MYEENKEIVGRIQSLAKSKGISMKHLCDSIGKYRSYLACVRDGKVDISKDDLMTIAAELGTTAPYLLGYVEEPEAPMLEDDMRLQYLLSLAKQMSKKQFIDLEKYAIDIIEQPAENDGKYLPLENDKRDLIKEIASMKEEISGKKRLMLNAILFMDDDELNDSMELLESYKQLSKSKKRQALGKVYELLDSQSISQSGEEVAPPDVDLVTSVLDGRIKK